MPTAYKPFSEAAVLVKRCADGSVFVELEPGNATRYPIWAIPGTFPGFLGDTFILCWNTGFKGYTFAGIPDWVYLADKLDLKEGDAKAIAFYMCDLIQLLHSEGHARENIGCACEGKGCPACEETGNSKERSA